MLILIFLVAIISGCGGTTSQQPRQAVALGSKPAIGEEFDPQTLDDDDFLLKPTSGTRIFMPPSQTRGSSQIKRSTKAKGYRVQITAVLDRLRAESFQTRSEQLLKQRIYVVYDERTRLYKLHVGNCRTALEAETLRRDTKEKGYSEAFIVRSSIESAPSPYRIPTRTGYRVQIFSASGRGSAEKSVQKAKVALERDDIYIAFEPPYFKVQVGDFETREAADKFVQMARKQGYDTPFPVQAEIRAGNR
ncbi:MAG: SPOR domain-containing protein [Candidatus Latescibacterota bacterium]|nr:SPOR domain-containing protein [Candidatus Latescibacterota bacterium]